MNKHKCPKLENIFNGVFKVALMTFVLDLIYIAIRLPIKSIGLMFGFLFVSQIVALVGSLCIGLPVALALNKMKYNGNIISALVCGSIVFLIIFFYLGDGKISSHNFEGSTFISIYGLFCGYAYMYGYKKENNA